MSWNDAPTAVRDHRRHLVWLARILLAFLAIGTAAAAERPWCSTMLAPALGNAGQPGAKAPLFRPLPLERAAYRVEVLGNLALGRLELEFRNDSDQEVQAHFVSQSPPAGVTVDSLQLRVAGEVKQRQESIEATDSRRPTAAPRGGAQAKPQPMGLRSGEIAIPVGGTLIAEIRFQRWLDFREGTFELLLPRLSGRCTGLQDQLAPQQTAAAQAPLDVTIELYSDHALPVVDSPSHNIIVDFENDHTLVELAAPDDLWDAAFRLHYVLGQQTEPSLSAFVGPDVDGVRDVLLVLAPAKDTAPETVRPKEALFLIDTSGSMRGSKIIEARGAIYSCLEKLGAEDRFDIAKFDQSFSLAFEELEDATPGNLEQVRAWLDGLPAQGATSLLPALDAVMKLDHDPSRHRIVIVVTDGQLGDRTEVEQFLTERLGEARFFVVGIGENVQRETILRLAEIGRGTAAFAGDAGQLNAAVEELFDGIAAAVAWDVELLWGAAEIVEMQPSRLPDLYAGRPLTLRARIRGELPPSLEVTASTMDGDRVFRVALPGGGARVFEALQRTDRAAAPRPVGGSRGGGR